MAQRKIYVDIAGGCFQGAKRVPRGYSISVIDWDNLMGDEISEPEWNQLDQETKQFVQDNYPAEYRLIQDSLAASQRERTQAFTRRTK
ncbi:MAG TPA: hypothetical protein VN661_01360 [Candidatus Acidoferrales bacterium]|nr:hypothetical protein [Candidatus Acidoferrales bacterium]